MKNKNILITGADGFIGSHLAEILFNKGYNVSALVQYNSFNSIGNLSDTNLHNKINIILFQKTNGTINYLQITI